LLVAPGDLSLFLKTTHGRLLYWTSGDVPRNGWTSVHFCINNLWRANFTVLLEARRGTAGPKGRNKLAVDDISLEEAEPLTPDCLTQRTLDGISN